MAVTVTRRPEDTVALGRRLGQRLAGGELIAFTGPMGAGKTTMCQGIALGLGSVDPVQSPSYAIANLYRGRLPFAHFDAWRITGPEDLEAAGFYDYLESGAVVAMEWSERVAEWLGDAAVRVDIAVLEDGGRRIAVQGVEGL